MPLQMLFATNELVASTMFVPPNRFGPPESPKQVPPLLECSLMNSPLMELLLATNVVVAKNRVVESPGSFLQGPLHVPFLPSGRRGGPELDLAGSRQALRA